MKIRFQLQEVALGRGSKQAHRKLSNSFHGRWSLAESESGLPTENGGVRSRISHLHMLRGADLTTVEHAISLILTPYDNGFL